MKKEDLLACGIHIGKVPEDIAVKIAGVDPVGFNESTKRLSEKLKLALKASGHVAVQESSSPSASSSGASSSGSPAASGQKRSREEQEADSLNQLG